MSRKTMSTSTKLWSWLCSGRRTKSIACSVAAQQCFEPLIWQRKRHAEKEQVRRRLLEW